MSDERQAEDIMPWMQAPTVPGVEAGAVLADKYEVEQVLGVGGMGVVVKARHIALDTPVAMKFLLPEFVENEELVARFLREAKSAVAIKNRHVAQVMDIGTLESGSPYMVMEFLKGRDLADVIAKEGRIEEPFRAGRLLLQACEGLAAAHAKGIVHRDIKPGNLFLTLDTDGSEQVKILDFGISKNDDELNHLTRTGTVMGSPMYMSPEQMRSARDVDPRADVWALGVVAYEMLTGRLPYQAETMTELVYKVVHDQPPRLRDARPELPEALDHALDRALTKDPGARYQSVAELARGIADALGDPVSSSQADRTSRILAGGPEHSIEFPLERARNKPASHIRTRAETAPTIAQTPMAQRKQPGPRVGLYLGIGGAVLLLLALAAVFAFSGGEEATVEPSRPREPPTDVAPVLAAEPERAGAEAALEEAEAARAEAEAVEAEAAAEIEAARAAEAEATAAEEAAAAEEEARRERLRRERLRRQRELGDDDDDVFGTRN